jgi:tetratricopeptide (TPR) repeat protein
MKQRLIKTIALLTLFLSVLMIWAAQVSAYQTTPPTLDTPVPTSPPASTPTPNLDLRMRDLETEQRYIKDLLETGNTTNLAGMVVFGTLVAALVAIQSFFTYKQLRREEASDKRRARSESRWDRIDRKRERRWNQIDRKSAKQMYDIMDAIQGMLESRFETEKQARKAERASIKQVAEVMDVVQKTLETRLELDHTGVGQVSKIMDVIQQTLESRLEAEKQAGAMIKELQGELDSALKQVRPLELFYQRFQTTIRETRDKIEKQASLWAREIKRHDFRGMSDDLNIFARQFDTFKSDFEPLEEPPGTFSARVPYIRGVAAHYANQPGIAKKYLEEVVSFPKPELDEEPQNYDRRIANTYYYIGLTKSNFGNYEDAIESFEKANQLDHEDKDFLTMVVTAEAYIMMDNFNKAQQYIDLIEKRLHEIESEEGTLRNFHRRLQSRAALIRASMAILKRDPGWHEKATELLEKMYVKDPQYYYATATLAQVYYDQGDHDKAKELFSKAYATIEHSGHLITVTEARSKILLLMTAGMCCKHGLPGDARTEGHLDTADGLRSSLPRMGPQICTVFSVLNKRNESSDVIHRHIEAIRERKVLLLG